MQADQLTLVVDTENTGTNPVNEIYSRYEEQPNRTTYIGASHTPDARDSLAIYRTFPTKTGNFKGTAKSSVKFTKDVTVAGVDSSTSLTAPIIIEVSFSVPVGTDAYALVAARQRVIAALDNDTFMNALNTQLMI